MTHISPVKQRVQITFGKFGALKYTGNLDIAKTWERVLRRAKLPLLYTQGFNTRPRLQLASALPLGITSECEIIDVAMKEPVELDGLIDQLLPVSPEGLRIYAVKEVSIDSPALQTLVSSAEYRVHFEDGLDSHALQNRIDALLATETILRIRYKKGKESSTNLRPFVHRLDIDPSGDLILHLAVGANGNVRPEEVLAEMGLADEYATIHRFRLHLEAPPSE